MSDYDLIVRNACIVTEDSQTEGDIAVKNGCITAIEPELKGTGAREIDARRKFVLPGGVDSHVHVEQKSGMGVMCADDFYTGTVSAAFGGTTTIIPFAAQHRGMSLRKVVQDYHEVATPKAVIDYAFHLIVSDPTPQALGQELPALIKDGYTSFKIYMTYDALKLSDYQILDILALARREGALVMVHAENHDIIRWLTQHLVDQSHVAPKFHAVAHARIAEAEATNRAISLARLVDAPMLIVQYGQRWRTVPSRSFPPITRPISSTRRARSPRATRRPSRKWPTACLGSRSGCRCSSPRAYKRAASACNSSLRSPRPTMRGSTDFIRAKARSPPPAPPNPAAAGCSTTWPPRHAACPCRRRSGRCTAGRSRRRPSAPSSALGATFRWPRSPTCAVGSDADFAIWDADKEITIRWKDLHDNVGYTPYEGREIRGWPITVVSRGRVIVEDGKLHAERGSGQFLPCASPDSSKPLGRVVPELQAVSRFGGKPLF
jgi:dihydropyrimidinase